MLAIITDNISTIVVLLVVVTVVAVISAGIIRNRKKGKTSCSCGTSCGGCSGAEICHGTQKR